MVYIEVFYIVFTRRFSVLADIGSLQGHIICRNIWGYKVAYSNNM